MIVTGRPWNQAEHSRFPPVFKAVVQTLLLAQRRASVAVQPTPLALLPAGVVLDVFGAAAYPLSPWLPE